MFIDLLFLDLPVFHLPQFGIAQNNDMDVQPVRSTGCISGEKPSHAGKTSLMNRITDAGSTLGGLAVAVLCCKPGSGGSMAHGQKRNDEYPCGNKLFHFQIFQHTDNIVNVY